MKKLISADLTGINQILPHKNKWAWDLYLKGVANNWTPSEISMSRDVEQWRSRTFLSEDERLLVKRCLGFFAGAESLVANNLLLAIFRVINDGECRQYIGRQMNEELIHNHTVVYICDSLNLDIAEVYEAYKTIPSIKAKDDFLMQITTDLGRADFQIVDAPEDRAVECRKEILRNLISYYIICEGIFFYAGFAMLLSFGRQNKLPGISEQIYYSLRDECVSEDTEFLTRRGWVKAPDLTGTDEVAQVHDDLSLDFVKPLARSVSVVDHLYSFSNEQNHVNLLVSPNHRMVKIKKEGGIKIESAERASYHPYAKQVCAAKKRGGTKIALSPEERFRIAFQADGHKPPGKYRNGNYCGYIRVNIALKRERKIERLRVILHDCGYEYDECIDNRGYTVFKINAPPHCVDKKLNWFDPAEVTCRWCVEFIDEIGHWDGHFVKECKGDRITWGCVDPENADAVQMVAALAGYRTTCRVWTYKHSKRPYNRVQICKSRDYVRGSCIEKTRVDGFAKVYGVEVPTGMVLVRRNGAVAVTGNCVHLEFGTKLINLIIEQEPQAFGEDFQLEVIERVKRATELEIAYAHDVLPRGVLGLNADLFVSYMHYIANMRLEAIGLPRQFKSTKSPFPWMAEVVEMRKRKNFFETRVTEYQTGGGLVDDF